MTGPAVRLRLCDLDDRERFADDVDRWALSMCGFEEMFPTDDDDDCDEDEDQ